MVFGFIGKLLGLGGSAPKKIELSKVSASAGLPIIYGRRRVKPIAVFKIVSQKNMAASNANYDHVSLNYFGNKDKNHKSNDWLHRIDVWGQGEITGIERFWIDGDPHTAIRFNGRPYFRALSKYGSENQTAAHELAIGHPDWTGVHQGKGVAYTWARFYNSGQEPQFQGEPRLEVQVRGLKCYDPRQGETQVFNDPDTWTYSENRALAVLNYLMGSFGFSASEQDVDLDSFMVAADLCDETMTIPAPAVNTGLDIPDFWNWEIMDRVQVRSEERLPGNRLTQADGETEQAQYAVGAILDPKEGVVKNTKLLLEGMGWALPWSNGKHKLIIEGPVDGPVMHFDEDSIMGGWNVERGMRSDRLNRVTVEFPNANKQYQDDTVSWPPIGQEIHNAYKAEDQGQDLHTNKSADTITDFYRAQAYAEYLVRKSRVNPRIRGLQLSPKAMLLEPGDVISIYYKDKGFGREIKADGTEYEGTLFIVERVDVSAFLDVRVDLIKYDPTVYGAPALEREPIPNSPYNPDWWRQAPAPTGLALEEVDERNADGTVIRGIKATWVLPEGLNGIASVEVEWKKSSEPDYRERMTLAAGSEEALIMGLLNDAISYDVRVRYVTQRNQKSAAAEETITMEVVQSVLDLLADGQLVFADFWDFGPTAKGWTAEQAVLDEDGNSIDIHTIGADAKLISPAGLRIEGSKWDKVIVRMKRLSAGDGQKWEQAYLYYNTTSRGGFNQRFREFSNARYDVGRYVTFVFDMGELSSRALTTTEKQDWVTSIITQIRFDPTSTANDHLTIDWIGIGRSAPSISAAHSVNLVSDLGFKKFDAVDTGTDSNFTAKTLDAMNLVTGEAISAGIEVIASGTRRGRLKLEFLNTSDGVVETHHSPWSTLTGTYEQVKLEALYIPTGTYRIRAWLEREDSGTSAVGARYYTLNAGSAVVRYAPVRDDVQEGATRTVHRGVYNNETSYDTGDVVTYLGSSYLFSGDGPVINKLPTNSDYWSLLASAGAAILVEYSAATPPVSPHIDSEWHSRFNPLADRYMRQSIGGGNWTEAMLIVGENGSDGPFTDYRFIRSNTQPQRNANNSEPSRGSWSWSDALPSGTAPVWMISVKKNADGTLQNGASWSYPTKLTGDAGGHYSFVFTRSLSQPALPTGPTPEHDPNQVWSDGPPPANNYPLWMSKGFLAGDGSLLGGWSTPTEAGGTGIKVQYSSNGYSWRIPPFRSGDIFMRQLVDGAWSDPIRIVGENGRDGADGQNGANGRDGADGQNGANGRNGADGRDGTNGDTGPRGPAGGTVTLTQLNDIIEARWLQLNPGSEIP